MNQPSMLDKVTDILATPIDYVSPDMKINHPNVRKGIALVGIPAATIGLVATGVYLSGNKKKVAQVFNRMSKKIEKFPTKLMFGKRKSKKRVMRKKKHSRA